MDILNNREIAFLIWGGVALIWVLKEKVGRKSLFTVITTAFAKSLVKVYIWMLSYIGLIIYGLYEMDFWELGQLKNTLVWSMSVAPMAVFKVQTIKQEKDYFRSAFKSSLSLAIVLEFVVGFYSFNLIVELVWLPVLTFLGVIKVIASDKENLKPIETLVDGVLVVFGVFGLIYTGHNFVIGLGEFATLGTLTDFYTPIVLSILYLPFIYVLAVYESYDRWFSVLLSHVSDSRLRRFIKCRAFIAFRLNWAVLERWFEHFSRIHPTTRPEITKSIRDIKALIAYEKNPKVIPIRDGWSPYEAKDYLTGFGLETRDYNELGEDDWFCGSNMLELDDALIPNNLAYYVSGDRYAANVLKLCLNMNTPSDCGYALNVFVEATTALLDKALGLEITNDLATVLQEGLDAQGVFSSDRVGNKTISVTRQDFPNQMNNGYCIDFKIETTCDR